MALWVLLTCAGPAPAQFNQDQSVDEPERPNVAQDRQRDASEPDETAPPFDRPEDRMAGRDIEVQTISFLGNKKYSRKDLLEQIDFVVGDRVDEFALQNGRENIALLYSEAGYANATVTIDVELAKAEGIVEYIIEEGPRVRVRKILFEGNDNITSRQLLKQIETGTYIWLFRTGAFDREGVERDAARIQNYYHDEGFLDARASYRLEFDEGRENLTITFTVHEGTCYVVRSVEFQGVTVFDEQDIQVELTTQPGSFVHRRVLDDDVKTVRTLYGEYGYIYTNVSISHAFTEEPGTVVVMVTVDEGEPFSIGRIVIRGNESTKDKVVRRELAFFPNETFNTTKLKESERHVRETQLFSSVSISPVGDQPDVRDVLVDVTETERSSQFLMGVGVTSNSGVVGSFVIDLKNFDLFDWPRSFGELIRGKSFHGAGQQLRIEAQPGTELTRFRVDFREPYFLDKQLTFGTGLYLFERGRDGWDEERFGGNVSFGKRFNEGFLEGWAGEVALRLENVDVGGVDYWDADRLQDDKGSHYLSTAKATLVRDRTDSRFMPSSGDRLLLSWEQAGVAGGDFFFGKLMARYAWHKTLSRDLMERKSILSLKASSGLIFGRSPVFERFYAGGIGSLRGFEFRGVSPREGDDDQAIGGDFMMLTSAEYSFPLYAETIRGVLFTDMGTVEEDFGISDWRMSVGFGIRLQVDFFGPIPMEFDLAMPVSKSGDDEEQIFSFFIGAVF